jgi:hypothetical protein
MTDVSHESVTNQVRQRPLRARSLRIDGGQGYVMVQPEMEFPVYGVSYLIQAHRADTVPG